MITRVQERVNPSFEEALDTGDHSDVCEQQKNEANNNMKSLFSFFILIISCCSCFAANENAQQDKSQKNAILEAGTSLDNPIIFKEILDFDKLKKAQDRYIRENYPDYELATQLIYIHNKRYIYQAILKNDLGQEKNLYFDTTDASLAYQKQNKGKIQGLIKEAEEATKKGSKK